MDSKLLSENSEDKLNDTGQNSTITVLGHLSCEQEYSNQQNSQETEVCSDCDIMVGKCPLAPYPKRTDSLSLQSEIDTSCSTQVERDVVDNLSEKDQVRSRTAKSFDEIEENVRGSLEFQESLDVTPKIIIHSEDQESRNAESANDEDMDPLLAMDDSESQSSDLINFDTVSYDVIHQLGVDEDDDEKSIATVSSLSCDVKVDSLQKHSLASNSSSLVNLLDSSLKETSGLDRSLSPQMMASGLESIGSSCPSSPSHHSSKTTSLGIDDCVSDPSSNPPADPDGTCTQSNPQSEDIGENFNEICSVDIRVPQPPSTDKSNERPTKCDRNDVSKTSMADLNVINDSEGTCVSETHSNTSVVESESDSERSNQLYVISSGDSHELLPSEFKTLDLSIDLSIQSPSNDYDSASLFIVDGFKKIDEITSSGEVAKNSCKSLDISEGTGTDSFDGDSILALRIEENIQTSIEERTQEVDCATEFVLGDPISLLTVGDGQVPAYVNAEIVPHITIEDVADRMVPSCINAEIVSNVTNEDDVADISEVWGHDLPSLSAEKVPDQPSSQDKVVISGSETRHGCERMADEILAVLCDEEIAAHDSSLMHTSTSPPLGQDEVATSVSESQMSCGENVDDISAVLIHEESAAPHASSSLDKTPPNPSNGDETVSIVVASEMIDDEIVSPQSSSFLENLDTEDNNSNFSCEEAVTSDEISTDFEICYIERTADPSEGVKTPPVDSAVSVSDSTLFEDSIQPKTSECSNDTTEPCAVEMAPPGEICFKDKVFTVEYISSAQAHLCANELQKIHPRSKIENKIMQTNNMKVIHLKKDITERKDMTEADRASGDMTAASQFFSLESPQNVFDSTSYNKIELEWVCARAAHSQCDISNTAKAGVIQSEANRDLSITDVGLYAMEADQPVSLPDMKSSCKSPKKSLSVDLSEFWRIRDHLNSGSAILSQERDSKLCKNVKQFNAATLDEAQQTASLIVDDVLQKAILKAEEILIDPQKVTHKLAFDVNAENLERKGSGCHSLSDPSEIGKSTNHGEGVSSTPSYDESDSKIEQDKSLSEPHQEETFVTCSNSSCESGQNLVDENVSERTFISEGDSLNESLESEDRRELESAVSLQGDSSDFSRGSKSSLLIETDLEFHSQASQLVDGIIDLAVQKCEESHSQANQLVDGVIDVAVQKCERFYSQANQLVDGVIDIAVQNCEESSTTYASSIKPKSLLLDDDFFQEEEELATPCGEMLTEHFMDFESGRNVSVFCSIPESGSEDHLLAYDRIVNTIGNREVDSDTGKSVSVFRSEEEVFYEIQRASTCTSVFESVEEEDEDMIDTTVPVENRSDITLAPTKISNSEKRNIADDSFNKDCDAFEDAVDAFLTKERLARDDLKSTTELVEDNLNMSGDMVLIRRTGYDHSEDASCKVICVKHPEYDLSNKEEKKRMAEKWANGGESEVPNTPEMHAKQKAIREALDSEEDVAAKLCKLALTEGGLINDALRREAWPRMLGLDPTVQIDAPSLEDLKSHPEYEQVVLDVNRSLKRFPPDIPKDQWETLQDKLTRLIMYVISKHPHLRYYQGYHDVAVTFLLVVGESIAFQIMERLSTEHLSDCMQPTMERTSYLLLFIYPLIQRLHPTLADYLERSEVGTMFCLPWFLTWFGHSLDRYQDVVRLYDHFLASPPLAPLYLAAVLVAHRADEVLAVDCDMAAIHALLSHIPDTLPLEILLRDATDLYVRFPPESIEREVEERFRNEQESRALGVERQRQRTMRRRRGNNQGSGSWQLVEFQDRIGPALNRWIPPWVVQQQRLSMRLLFASATFFVGFYVYSRGGDMLPYP